MNIAFITPGILPLPPVDGGAVENLIQMFIDENEVTGEHNITVYSIESDKAKLAANKYNYCEYKYTDLSGIVNRTTIAYRYIINRFLPIYIGNGYISKVKRMLEIEKPNFDIVIVENKPQYGLVLSELFPNNMVLHLHNDWLNSNTKFAKQTLNSFHAVFTISNFINSSVRTIYESKKIQTLYNGIDLEKFNPILYNQSNIRKKYGLSDDDVIILYSGRLVPEKGIKELLEAFCLVTDHSNAKLVIVGSSFYSNKSNDKFSVDLKKKVNGNIIFTGFIEYEQMPEVYSIADIGVIPSIWEEPFALTVIEQMAMQTPVIISDSGGMIELVDNKSAYIVKRGDSFIKQLKESIVRLIEEKDIRKSMGENARIKAKEFSKKKYSIDFNFLLYKANEELRNKK
ncbi:glycosyltransferase family 4 protein [Paenibacillus sp.]|uniref:glycosyltransferase family 4 protein n=1 Tax=Paenibacillus sp. TaxID=58172 RepID=UPI0028B2431E|nr:glycosyltransferase family 4 protein [Paenibacillus sp.]